MARPKTDRSHPNPRWDDLRFDGPVSPPTGRASPGGFGRASMRVPAAIVGPAFGLSPCQWDTGVGLPVESWG
jgi:hypothetical protein